jgi:hypothetical protein
MNKILFFIEHFNTKNILLNFKVKEKNALTLNKGVFANPLMILGPIIGLGVFIYLAFINPLDSDLNKNK